jgi:hypothetical protein
MVIIVAGAFDKALDDLLWLVENTIFFRMFTWFVAPTKNALEIAATAISRCNATVPTSWPRDTVILAF